MTEKYIRQSVERFILQALQSLGGSATKQEIKKEIVADDRNPITYQHAFEPIFSKNGKRYIPFNFDFNTGLVNLHTCGYIGTYERRGDITLTEIGRVVIPDKFPTADEQALMDAYWSQEEACKQQVDQAADTTDTLTISKADVAVTTNDDSSDDWRVTILEQIKQFSPRKFESFSRLLMSHMGIKFDREKGVRMTGDHGIDGYGYFESDEFRTAKVVIQCKRYRDIPVSEPEIDKFKGVMLSFNADYGIFITTSVFTRQAQQKAVQGSNVVTLIDGQRLVELIEKYQLHITPVQTYQLNDYYFEKD